jgi:tight adherence protein C
MAGSAGALPDLALRLLARRRRRAIEQALSFFLDLVLSLLQAGVGMEEAFRVAAQTGLSPGHPLATEAAQLGADLAIGRDRSTAFLLLAARSGAPSLTALANTVAEGLRRGVSFERLLTTHAELARARRREAATKRLELANAEILLPLLLCGLPSFVVLVVLPLGLQVYEALTGVAAVLGP